MWNVLIYIVLRFILVIERVFLEEKFNNRQKAEEKMIETFVEGKERETNKKENEEVFYLGKDEPSR